MWGRFTVFGEFISGLFGLFLFWKITITCINTGLNISLLYQTFSLSIKLVAGIFTSIIHFIMHNARQELQQQQQEQNQSLLIFNQNHNPQDNIDRTNTNSIQKKPIPRNHKIININNLNNSNNKVISMNLRNITNSTHKHHILHILSYKN